MTASNGAVNFSRITALIEMVKVLHMATPVGNKKIIHMNTLTRTVKLFTCDCVHWNWEFLYMRHIENL